MLKIIPSTNMDHYELLLVLFIGFIGVVLSAEPTYYCENHKEAVVISGVDSGMIRTVREGSTTYDLNMDCSWIIQAGKQPYKRIHISVIKSDLQWTSSDAICSGVDLIDIRDGEFSDSDSLAIWCGTMNPRSLISSGSNVHIKFSTDDRRIYAKQGVTLQFTLFGDTDCPPGYILESDYCYSFKTHRETWTAGQQYCNNDQANLVSFQTNSEANKIIAKAKELYPPLGLTEMWIGLSDIHSETEYKWIDDTPLNVTLNWYVLPHEAAKYLDCILVRTEDGFWREEFCTDAEVQTTRKYPFICKRKRIGLTTLFPIPRVGPEREGNKGKLPPKALIIALTAVAVGAVLAIGAVVYLMYVRQLGCWSNSDRQTVTQTEAETGERTEERIAMQDEHPPSYDEVVKTEL